MPVNGQSTSSTHNSEHHRVVKSADEAGISLPESRSNKHLDDLKPSLVQDPYNPNNWPRHPPFNQLDIEVRPTTLASLQARDLGAGIDKGPNAISGNRGGRRCRHGGNRCKPRLRGHHGGRPEPKPGPNENESEQGKEPDLASLQAREFEAGIDNEPNAITCNSINCDSFGIRGGRRCQHGGHRCTSRFRGHHGGKPEPELSEDESEQDNKPDLPARTSVPGIQSNSISKRVTLSLPCSDPRVKDSPYCAHGASHIEATLAALAAIDAVAAQNPTAFNGTALNGTIETDLRTLLEQAEARKNGYNDVNTHIDPSGDSRQSLAPGIVSAGFIAPVVIFGLLLLGTVGWSLRRCKRKRNGGKGCCC